MALAYTVSDSRVVGTEREVRGTVAFDASYPTGGESLSGLAAACGLSLVNDVKFFPHEGFVFEWDSANAKVLAYYGDNDNASDGALVQVPNTTDISAQAAVQFVAKGY